MTERERLIELLRNQNCHIPLHCDKNCKYAHLESCYEARIADLLLANGVTVPPCKVGDTVYTIKREELGGHWEDDRYIVDDWSELKVCEIPFSLTLWECGWKDVFLSREDAEKALKERSEGK